MADVDSDARIMMSALELLEKIHLFDKKELRAICKKRKDLENKTQRRSRCMEDYLRYIQYEMELLKLIQLRREKRGRKEINVDVDRTVTNHINKLFKQAIFRFEEDVRIWTSYMKFCKHMKYIKCDRQMLSRMVTVHSDKPALWKLAAGWELEENHSIENAREYLLKGIHYNPDSKQLHIEAFRLELLYADIKVKQLTNDKSEAASDHVEISAESSSEPQTAPVPQEQPQNGQNINGHLPTRITPPALPVPENKDENMNGADVDDLISSASLVYESASKNINDITFFIGLLEIAKEFSFTHILQTRMTDDLLKKFQNDERAWDLKARRMLQGLLRTNFSPSDFVFQASGENMFCEENGTSSDSKVNRKERIRRCFDMYSESVKQLSTERMWCFFLETFLELYQNRQQLPKFKRKLLLRAFQNAHAAGLLQEKYYVQWHTYS